MAEAEAVKAVEMVMEKAVEKAVVIMVTAAEAMVAAAATAAEVSSVARVEADVAMEAVEMVWVAMAGAERVGAVLGAAM
jgi:hypothetical protein